MRGFLLLSVCAFFLNACQINEPHYSNTPQIQFQGISRYPLEASSGIGHQKRDSLVLTVSFTDGDGNLGDDSRDSSRYSQAGGWGNYLIRTFRLENNQYRELDLKVNNSLFFPRLSREGQKGPIEGTLDFRQLYYYTQPYKVYPTKFRIKIRDQALNVSNEVETDTINIPYPN